MTMRIYPCLASGYFILFLMYAEIIFMYYFNDMKGCVLTGLVFCLITLVGSIISSHFTEIWYGAGLVVGSFAGWTVAYGRLRWMEKLLDVHIFFNGHLLKKKKAQIETEMQSQLNRLLVSYKGHVGRVELSDSMENFNIKLYHSAGNEISLNQLNAASKQIFIQVLLKVLRNLGDYNPPVMIDTVMGVLDNESRDALMEEYFPQLAEQTILLCTTSEIRTDSDYIKLEPFISKTYTLHRNVEEQNTTIDEGYFGIPLNQ